MLNQRPRGSLCWVMAFFTASYQHLLNSSEPQGPFGLMWLSLPQLVYNCVRSLTGTVLTSILTELYNSSMPTQSPTRSLKSYVWSSSSGNNCHAVHRSLSSGASVYECTMGIFFSSSHFISQFPPTRFPLITAIRMCHLLPWNGIFGRVEGQNITSGDSWYPRTNKDFPLQSQILFFLFGRTIKIKLKGSHFSGKEFETNKRYFKDFLTKFENCAASISFATGKLYFFRCSLEGRSFQFIDHLSVSEDIYLVALKLLRDQYLDEEEIRREITQGMLDFHLENPKDLVGLKDFIIKPQADVGELWASYNCDLHDDTSAKAIIISQVLFAKLPSDIKGKPIRISGKTYWTLSEILL